jgi:hypothetical protein
MRKSEKTTNNFDNYFRKSTQSNFTEEEFNKVFSDYSELTFPQTAQNAELAAEIIYPLKAFKTKKIYKENISQLLSSSNVYHRMLAYTVVGASNDTTYSKLLRERIKTEESEEGLNWSAMALLNMRDKHTTQLFDFLVKHENFGDAHLIPMYLQLDKDSLIYTCRNKIGEENAKSKVLALQVLAHVDQDQSTDSLIVQAVNTWDKEIKGYAIVALQMRKTGNLKPILEPFIHEEKLRRVILQTLEKSPTKSDSLFAAKIKSETKR